MAATFKLWNPLANSRGIVIETMVARIHTQDSSEQQENPWGNWDVMSSIFRLLGLCCGISKLTSFPRDSTHLTTQYATCIQLSMNQIVNGVSLPLVVFALTARLLGL
jgi:hypothetical protein